MDGGQRVVVLGACACANEELYGRERMKGIRTLQIGFWKAYSPNPRSMPTWSNIFHSGNM